MKEKTHVIAVGGAGYIGSHVVRELLDAGYPVTIIDNLSTGLRENIPSGVPLMRIDIRDQEKLREAMRGLGGAGREAGGQGLTKQGPETVVIHLAALKAAGESMERPEIYAEQNIAGTIGLLNAMTEAGINSLVFSSSAAVYGEPQYLPVDEKHPTNPSNFYGYTKLAIEELLQWYFRLRGVASVSLRYFNAAGYDPAGRVSGLERNPANLLPIIMEVAAGTREKLQIYGNDYDTADGTGVRDYVHVSDLARAHLQAVELLATHRQCCAVNLGSETGISVEQMLGSARRISGHQIPAEVAPRRAGDPAALVASSAAARALLGWEPHHSDVDTLVATTWAAYQGQKNHQAPIQNATQNGTPPDTQNAAPPDTHRGTL